MYVGGGGRIKELLMTKMDQHCTLGKWHVYTEVFDLLRKNIGPRTEIGCLEEW